MSAYHVADALLDQGVSVTGVDNLNAYYPVELKKDRLRLLEAREGFDFQRVDIADHQAMRLPGCIGERRRRAASRGAGGRALLAGEPFRLCAVESGRTPVDAGAGPARATASPRLVYASSSSVYGANTKAPFSEDDRVDTPVSLYAATKRSDELMSEAYSRLYGMEQVGLRFFTVYGPWGRPDMAYWSFTRDILEGRPIRVFNNGDLQRDFTWIDDIVEGVVSVR